MPTRKNETSGLRQNIAFTAIVGAIIISATLVFTTIWIGRATTRDTNHAVNAVSGFYLQELTDRREQVVSATLNTAFKQIHNAVEIMEAKDLIDVKTLRNYLLRVKTICDWELFALVDQNNTIYRSAMTEHEVSNYPFLDAVITKPTIFTTNVDTSNPKVFLASPVEGMKFQGIPLKLCFMQLDLQQMLAGISLQSLNNNTTYCNLYYKNGSALTDVVLGGLSKEANLLDALDSAQFEANLTLDDVKRDFAEGRKGLVTFTYNGIKESMYYIPVTNTAWILTYLIREEKINEQFSFISTRLLRYSFFQVVITIAIMLGMFAILLKLRGHNISIEKAREVALAQNKAKSDFLSNMSHDIRTPMNAIIGFTNLALQTKPEETEKITEYLGKIQVSSNHLLSLINDVLEMSRIESGKIELDEESCNLPEILHDLNTIIIAQVEAKQQELHMDALNVTDENIMCDRLRLNQVLLNLLSNAVKYTPNGGKICIRISEFEAKEDRATYEILVKDNGIGMSPEFAEHIFEAFTREKTSTVSGIQGTGLGMAITKKIVDLMGGTIQVSTAPGEGTEFIVRASFKFSPEKTTQKQLVELTNIRALVVDDDFDTCDSTTKMLATMGLRPEWTLSGKEAVLRARQAREMGDGYGVFIIDWRLNDLNGIEVTRRIREQLGNETPILLMTAYDWPSIKDEATEAGVNAYCAKPLFMSELHRSLARVIGSTAANSGEEQAGKQKISFEGKRLLLVDDIDVNREIATMLLEMHGFVVEQAADGKQAVNKVQEAEPGFYDAVLMDIQMPVMNGYEASQAIRALPDAKKAAVPIVAMTANAFDEDRKQALDAGMNAHIAKPIDETKVMEVLQGILT